MARDQRRRLAADYPALARFLDGYFHQDFRVEHGSAARAAAAFVQDASETERAAVERELTRLRSAIDGTPAEEWRAIIERIGGSWRPASLASIDRVIAVLRPPG